MDYKLNITETAETSLDHILLYIMDTLCNPSAAIDLLNAVEEKYRNIQVYPYMYELLAYAPLASKGYRKIPLDNYIVIYQIQEAEKQVDILNIFYSGENYKKYL